MLVVLKDEKEWMKGRATPTEPGPDPRYCSWRSHGRKWACTHSPDCSCRSVGHHNQEDTRSGTARREEGQSVVYTSPYSHWLICPLLASQSHPDCTTPCWLNYPQMSALSSIGFYAPTVCTVLKRQQITHLPRSIVDAESRLWGTAALIRLAGVHRHADSTIAAVAQVTGTKVLTWPNVDARGLGVAGSLKTGVLSWGGQTGKLYRARRCELGVSKAYRSLDLHKHLSPDSRNPGRH